MRLRSSFIASSSLALGLLGACTNGQIGGEVGVDGDGQESASDGCIDDSTQVLDEGETTSLGFSARALMDAVVGEHTTGLSWIGSLDAVNVTPAAGHGKITLTVIPDRSSAVFVHRKSNSGPMEGALAECGDEVRFDVHLTVKSDNGALDTAFDTTLRAEQAHLVRGNVAIEPDGSRGSFTVTTSDGSVPRQTTLDFGFVDGSPSGQLSGILEMTGDESVSAGSQKYAQFPVENCLDVYGYVIDPSSDLGRRAVDLLSQKVDYELTWQGVAPPTQLTVEPRLEGPLCLASPMSPSQIVATLPTRVKSADGRIDATWQLEGHVDLDAAGAPTHVGMIRQAYLANVFAAADFESQTGISGVDLGDAEEASFTFSTDRDVAGTASGELTVLAGAGADCSTETELPSDGGTSSPGCSGLDYQEIAHARLVESN